MRARCPLVILACALLSSCGAQPPPPPQSRTAMFDEQRAWKHLDTLCNMGPRPHGTEAQKKEQEYLRAELKACGAEVRDLPFEYRGKHDTAPTRFTNIAGRIKGRKKKWVLLGSHYDTRMWADKDPDPSQRDRSIEGANDGGSGVAVLLEVARVLKERPPDVGVEIVFFDGEDYGHEGEWDDYFLGSKDLAARWGELYPGPLPACAVILDMVGDAELSFPRDVKCDLANHPWLNDLLWKAAADLHAEEFGSGTQEITDDHIALLEAGIPATLLLDFTYTPHHTTYDTIDKCSAKSLGVTGRVLLRALVDQEFEAPK